MIEKLANIQPFLLIGMILFMYCIENVFPYLKRPLNRKQHDTRNFVLAAISFILNAGLSILVVMTVEQTAINHWGILNMVILPPTVKIISAILLLDLLSYILHNVMHKVPFLWRLHRIHHSDSTLNASSALRFHPLDIVVTQGVFQCLIMMVVGVSMTSFVIYGTIAIPLLIMQHSNVRFPRWVEHYASLIIATPGWHKIHHSSNQKETDSHYGDVFTFWDRIFGTWGKMQPHEIDYGLDEFKSSDKNKIGYLLKSPFKK
jgi:sterol desaturase/sphingolipid hydroxylase (fatty acid hydroxylase superfamily)